MASGQPHGCTNLEEREGGCEGGETGARTEGAGAGEKGREGCTDKAAGWGRHTGRQEPRVCVCAPTSHRSFAIVAPRLHSSYPSCISPLSAMGARRDSTPTTARASL